MANKVLLYIDASSPVYLMPEWDTKSEVVKEQFEARSQAATRLTYRHGAYNRVRMPVRYVSSADRVVVESWWLSEANLFMEEQGVSGVASVHIVNDSHPIPTVQFPYNDHFGGVIQLEGVFGEGALDFRLLKATS